MAKRYKYQLPVIHILFWGVLLVLPNLLVPRGYEPPVSKDLPHAFFTISNVFHVVLFYVNAHWLYPWLMRRRSWWLYIVSLEVLVGVCYYAKLFTIWLFYPGFTVTDDNWRFLFFPILAFLVVSILYRLIRDKIVADRQEKEKQAERLVTELKFLRSQISPHFLFNMLTNLVSLARKKSDLLEPSLIKLSDLVRYMLYESDQERSLLTQEIAYLQSYIELQQLRFDDVRVELDIDNDNPAAVIEPMLLIPFVENAFKHGVGIVNDPYIRIQLRVRDRELAFRVSNRYSKQPQSKDPNSGIGLQNIRTRLQLLYPDRHTLRIKEEGDLYEIRLNIQLSC
jgi:two-component system LytT family sensor kinase